MNAFIPALALSAFVVAGTPALAEQRTLDLPAFDKANIETSINAHIEIGDTQSIVAEASDAGLLDDLRIAVVGGELRAWVDQDVWDLLSFRNDNLTLTITVPALSAVSASSSAQVEVAGLETSSLDVEASSSADIRFHDLEVQSANLRASSSSTIVLQGTCKALDVEASSSADVDTVGLACETLDIDASSSAFARVFATEKADVNASSSARIEIAGNPKGLHTEVGSSAEIAVID